MAILCVVVALATELSGCSGLQTRNEIKKPGAGTSEESGRSQSVDSRPTENQAEGQAPEKVTSDNFLNRKLPKVGVLLGPGGMKSFAHLGVLRELERSRIPVDVVAGMEWGALMGGLYAMNGQVNDAEWKAFKLKESDLPEEEFLSKKIKIKPVQSLQRYLVDVFGRTLVENSKIIFSCPTQTLKEGHTYWLRRGGLRDAVKKCLPYPPLFESGRGYYAAPTELSEAVRWMKSQGVELVIYVDVLSQGEFLSANHLQEHLVDRLLWGEVRKNSLEMRNKMAESKERSNLQANVDPLKSDLSVPILIVDVNTTGFPLTDFKDRRLIMEAGQKAVEATIQEMVRTYGF